MKNYLSKNKSNKDNFKKKSNYKFSNRLILVGFLLVFGLVIRGIFKGSFHFSNGYFSGNKKVESQVYSSRSPNLRKELISTENTRNFGNQLLKSPMGNSSIDKKSMEYLNVLMTDSTVHQFFNYTLEFFKNKDGAYPAARFVSLMLVFDNSPEKIHLMGWTKSEIDKNSESIMSTLEEKKNEIFVNPYFHNRMLNLANLVNVSPERKIKFFADTIAMPLTIDSKGKLTDESEVMEVALILSKQNASDPSMLAPIIARSLASNSEPAQKLALQNRVLNYYPQLDYLFR